MFKSELLGSKPKHYQGKNARHISDNKLNKTSKSKSKSKKRVVLSGWNAPLGMGKINKSKSTDGQVKNFPITEDFFVDKIVKKITDKDLKPK